MKLWNENSVPPTFDYTIKQWWQLHRLWKRSSSKQWKIILWYYEWHYGEICKNYKLYEKLVCRMASSKRNLNWWLVWNWKKIVDVTVFSFMLIYKINRDLITWKCFPNHWPFVRRTHQSLKGSAHNGPVQISAILTSLNKPSHSQGSDTFRHHDARTRFRSLNI